MGKGKAAVGRLRLTGVGVCVHGVYMRLGQWHLSAQSLRVFFKLETAECRSILARFRDE